MASLPIDSKPRPATPFFIGTGIFAASGQIDNLDLLEHLELRFLDLMLTRPGTLVGPVLAPNPAAIRLEINGERINRQTQKTIHRKQWFDIETGTLESEATYVLHTLKIKESIRAYAHMAQPNILIVEYQFSTDQAVVVDLHSGFFANTFEHLLQVEAKGETLIWKAETAKRGVKFIVAESILSSIPSPYEVLVEGSAQYRHFHFITEPNTNYHLTKAIYLNHADKAGVDNPTLRLERALRKGVDGIAKSNQAFWKSAWERYGLEIKGDESVQAGMKAAMYRLISTRPITEQIIHTRIDNAGEVTVEPMFRSIDIDTLPIYLNCDVVAAETIVKRLVSALPLAKEAALRLGRRGAYYYKGTPEPLQIGETARVGTALIDFFDRSDPQAVLTDGALAVLIEVARFLQAVQSPTGQFRAVAIPDQVHPTVDDDALTNVRCFHVFQATVRILEFVRDKHKTFYQALTTALDAKREVVIYKNAAARQDLTKPDANGIIEAFEGYFLLQPIDTSKGEIGPERLPEMKITQMLEAPWPLEIFRMSPDQYTKQIVKLNWDFYETRICKTHSRNGIILGIVNYQFGLGKYGFPEFLECLGVKPAKEPLPKDYLNRLEEEQRNSVACYQMVVHGFCGVLLNGTYVRAIPNLPSGLSSVRFRLAHKNNTAIIKVGKEKSEWKWESIGG
jgi:trehalose/maltose hydrolase-like predicted phosphorylase